MFTPFQNKVWRACQKIPKGRVSTYKLIAKALGEPKAFRAIGNALNKNPYWPKVPCHRVIKTNGKVGGFAWGRKKKIKLLKKEGIKLEKGKIINLKQYLYRFYIKDSL